MVNDIEKVYTEYFQTVYKYVLTLSRDPRIAEEIPGLVAGDIAGEFMDKETAREIHRILHDMAEPYKEVFSLRTFGELSFREIGELFGKSENWAGVTYHRAKGKIKEALGK